MATFREIAAHSAYVSVPDCQFVCFNLGFKGWVSCSHAVPGHCLLVVL